MAKYPGVIAQWKHEIIDRTNRWTWRMPPLDQVEPARMTLLTRIGMIVLRGYLMVAAGLILVRIIHLAVAAPA